MGDIILGDCLEEMAKLDTASVDLILTDPSYSLPNNQFRPEARTKQRSFGEFSPYQHFFRLFVAEANRLLKPTGHLIIFCDETTYPVIYPLLYENFYATKLLIWDKQRIGMGGIWRRRFELITHSYKLPQKAKSGDSDILACTPVKDKLHTSQKPADLLEQLIEKTTKIGDLILDPFMGSGSTLIAAINTGREAVGIALGVAEVFVKPFIKEKVVKKVAKTSIKYYGAKMEQSLENPDLL